MKTKKRTEEWYAVPANLVTEDEVIDYLWRVEPFFPIKFDERIKLLTKKGMLKLRPARCAIMPIYRNLYWIEVL